MGKIKNKFYTPIVMVSTDIFTFLKSSEDYKILNRRGTNEGTSMTVLHKDPTDGTKMHFEIEIKAQPLMDPGRKNTGKL